MRCVLWILGCVCVIASLPLGSDRRFAVWGLDYGAVALGFLLFGFAELLGHVARLGKLFKPSAPPGTDRVRKDVDDFDRLRYVADQATCAGCGRRALKVNLRYNRALDAYYHPACLARDLSWSDPSQEPLNE